ncbi:MAG: hypothetical protein CME60_00575 [Halobacteriovoraceae bacterium]|nr:hypothetical protein [Halobacteriovoraceae bacterium]
MDFNHPFTFNIKKKKAISLGLTLLQLCLIKPAYGEESNFDVIYGKDNRFETSEYPDRSFRDKAKSVAAMVRTRSLRPDFATDPDNFTTFFKKTASRSYNVCKDEPYAEQNVLPICTGFLVAPDTLVTAGHCVTEDTPCDSYSWVFGFEEGTTRFSNDNIYRCKEVVSTELSETKFKLKDYAVIKLDREVVGREPLEFRKKGKPNWGEDLLIIGHPYGLPQKIADGAKVKTGNLLGVFKPFQTFFRKQDFFITNLDSFVGNSGSPVFNQETGLVEGILIEGADDFILDEEEGCQRTAYKKNGNHHAEEKVFRINRIEYLKNL